MKMVEFLKDYWFLFFLIFCVVICVVYGLNGGGCDYVNTCVHKIETPVMVW